MRKNLIRTSTLAAMAMAAVLSLSACDGDDKDNSGQAPSSPAAEQSPGTGEGTNGGSGGSTGGSGSEGTSAGSGNGGSTGGSSSGNGGSEGDGAGEGSGDKDGYGQSCGTNDLDWNASDETQAGGYILISVKAKEGITCWLPGEYPVVAFGSDGTEAAPLEHSVGEPMKLTGDAMAYAGVNPKTTNDNNGKELSEIIVKASMDDTTDPISLSVGAFTVDKPVVTNWHTAPADAVPGDSGTTS
ncbi:hypothetical protein HUT18_18705 [Streptomyces sp. NA04227]|uniref:DUF4232 domain-containing protein n=1 Tax=Streptomyces sp. NA04227 TaxID=2742136 RepID=UPI001591A6C6|nr:DUF4232 domain-containing protein [Streptomyces sp. NA04227]QKW08112.1 hypothetical protein HUT18_18705 [Streptomyces sp. NA04227]